MQPVLEAAARASARVHLDLDRGLTTLAISASIIPLLGFLVTIRMIIGCFVGGLGEKSTYVATICQNMAEAMIPSALGLLAGLMSFYGYVYLKNRLESFDCEMSNASLALANELMLETPRLRSNIDTQQRIETPGFPHT